MINNTVSRLTLVATFSAAMSLFQLASAAEYAIDTSGKHAFIQFKVSHLGYSYVLGEFPDFDGVFTYDADNPGTASVKLEIDTTTVDTRHPKRNVHIRGEDFLNVKKFPTAHFVSTGYQPTDADNGSLTGDLNLHGVTKSISIELTRTGAGKDPWGGYRAGFEGKTSFAMADFGIDYDLGAVARVVYIYFTIEGIRQ